MPRLIDADALMQLYKSEHSHAIQHSQYERARGWQGAMQLLYDAQTIDPESLRQHGRWVSVEGGSFYECSNCGHLTDYHLSNYCPNCGAKMDKESDNG